MILPNKYVTLSESYIGVSALILDILVDKLMIIDQLWDKESSNIPKVYICT